MSRAEELARDAAAHSDDLECRLLPAQALAWRGRGRDAEEVLTDIELDDLSETDLLAVALPRAAPELGLSRAWQLAAGNDPHGAVTAARHAAQMAERSGQTTVAVLVWQDAVRLGDKHADAPLERLRADLS